MKNVAKTSGVMAIFLLLVCTFFFAQVDGVCAAWSVYDMLSDDVILFYESEIAGEKIVSDKSQRQIESVASRYSIAVRKAKGLLLVYDFCARTGEAVPFPTLVDMKDSKIIRLVKARIKVFEESIDDERRAQLKEKAKDIIGF